MKRKTDNFSKFYNKKRNSAIKEEFRQEKKAAKKERKEAIERHFEERRAARTQASPRGPFRPGKGPAGAKGSQEASIGRSAVTGAKGPQAPSAAKGSAHSGPIEHLPLNKYIAHGGICSRRDAAELIRQGKVSVNGQVVTEPGTKVLPTDLVKVSNKKVTISHNFVYILLNKPKDYITTTDDPLGRKTVLDLIRQATTERVFPIGRLDRNTSGVLLLTNDGDLAQKLAHPSHEIKKIYHVVLDKALTKADFDKIATGQVVLEDGPAYVDALAYEDARDKTQIGLEIHSGRNRIVRRIFEHLGYDVRGLDRVMYAGLTKKNVQRGKWRLLLEKEIRILKYLNSSIKGSAARAKEWANQAEAIDLDTTVTPKTAAKAETGKPTAKAETRKPTAKPDTAKPAGSSDKRSAWASKRPAAKRPSSDAPGEDRSAASEWRPATKRPARYIPNEDRPATSEGRPSRKPAAAHGERRPSRKSDAAPRDRRPSSTSTGKRSFTGAPDKNRRPSGFKAKGSGGPESKRSASASPRRSSSHSAGAESRRPPGERSSQRPSNTGSKRPSSAGSKRPAERPSQRPANPGARSPRPAQRPTQRPASRKPRFDSEGE